MSNLTRLEQKVRLAVPGANLQVINSPDLWLFINDGAKDVNQRMKVRRVNTTFTDPAFGGGTPLAKFAISQFITDFVCFDDSGLYYQNGSLWQQLLPKDRKWMDENVYSWRNFQNGAPLYYIQEPDSLEILPPPAVVYNPSYWIYYIQQVVYMTNGDQFPFVGTNVEVPCLQLSG